MKREQVLELKTKLLRIASEIGDLKEVSAFYKDDMDVARNIYDETRSYDPTALRIYAERCDEYLKEKAKAAKKVCMLLHDDRHARMTRAEELVKMWVTGSREQRHAVVMECMAEAGMMAAVLRNLLADYRDKAQALLIFCEGCELADCERAE